MNSPEFYALGIKPVLTKPTLWLTGIDFQFNADLQLLQPKLQFTPTDQIDGKDKMVVLCDKAMAALFCTVLQMQPVKWNAENFPDVFKKEFHCHGMSAIGQQCVWQCDICKNCTSCGELKS